MEIKRPTRDSDKISENVMLNTIKSRKNLERTLSSLPIPTEFTKLLIICLIIFLVSVGISITVYIVYLALFQQEIDELNMIFNQSEAYVGLAEACSTILQAVSVQE